MTPSCDSSCDQSHDSSCDQSHDSSCDSSWDSSCNQSSYQCVYTRPQQVAHVKSYYCNYLQPSRLTDSHDEVAILVLPLLNDKVVKIEPYCKTLFQEFCDEHLGHQTNNDTTEKEVIFMMDNKMFENIKQFIAEVIEFLGDYQVFLHTRLEEMQNAICVLLSIRKD